MEEIRRLVDEAKNMVEEFQRDLNEAIEEYNQSVREFDVLKESISFSTMREIDEALNGVSNLPNIVARPLVKSDNTESLLQQIDPVEPYELEEPNAGTFAAKFWGFLTALLTFLGFGVGGAYIKGLEIDPSKIDMNWFNKAYSFYSELITGTPNDSAPAFGLVLTGGISLLLGYLVYWLITNRAATQNLQQAQAIYEAAKEYIQQKQSLLERVLTFKQFFNKAIQTVRKIRVFGDEFQARAKRIRFFEGNDFSKMVPTSQQDIKDLLQIKNDLEVAMEVKPYEKDGKVAPEVARLFDEVSGDVEKVKKRVYGK